MLQTHMTFLLLLKLKMRYWSECLSCSFPYNKSGWWFKPGIYIYIYIYLRYLFFPQEKQTTGYATTIDTHVVWEVWEILATLNEWSIYIALYCLLKLCFKLVQRHFYQSWLLERNTADAGHWWTLRICLFELFYQNWSVVWAWHCQVLSVINSYGLIL